MLTRLRVLPEDELILVLVKLVEYLGHQSAVTSAAAFTEVSQHEILILFLAYFFFPDSSNCTQPFG